MEAGRELDALIADKVMGMAPCDAWRPWNMGSAGGPMVAISYEDGRCKNGHERGKCYSVVMNGPAGGCPKYSTDIAVAWSVVEKLNENGWYVWVFSHGAHYGCWMERFDVNKDDTVSERRIPACEADTAPLAISLAALKAAGA